MKVGILVRCVLVVMQPLSVPLYAEIVKCAACTPLGCVCVRVCVCVRALWMLSMHYYLIARCERACERTVLQYLCITLSCSAKLYGFHAAAESESIRWLSSPHHSAVLAAVAVATALL